MADDPFWTLGIEVADSAAAATAVDVVEAAIADALRIERAAIARIMCRSCASGLRVHWTPTLKWHHRGGNGRGDEFRCDAAAVHERGRTP